MKRVYFLRPVGQLGPVKIGCSVAPECRLDSVTIWSPVRLEIVATAPGGHDKEAKLHGMFRKHHLHGEWFGASKELLALIDHVTATGELPELPVVVAFPTRRVLRAGKAKARRRPYLKLHQIDAAEAGRIRAIYDAGATLHEIADTQTFSVTRVRRMIIAAGGVIRTQGPREPQGLSEENRARIAVMSARYIGGETLKAIGDDYGITRERVRQLLRKADVPSAGHRPENCKKPHELTALEIEVARLYNEGTPPVELTSRYGLTSSQIRTAVQRCGYEIKSIRFWRTRQDDGHLTETICRLYQEGKSAREIVGLVDGISHAETAYRYLAKGGVSVRSNTRRNALEAQAAGIIEAYRNGGSIAAIAETFGASANGVTNLILRHGARLSKDEAERRRVAAVRRANIARANPTNHPAMGRGA